MDTTETSGHIVKRLDMVSSHLLAIEQHPALKLTPQQHQSAIVTAGDGLMRNAVQLLDRATADAKREQQALAALIRSIRKQDRQFISLVRAAAVGLPLGLLMSPALARLLPYGLNGQSRRSS